MSELPLESTTSTMHLPPAQALAQVGKMWWLPLVGGLASLGLGLAFLATDWTIHALVVVTGLAFVIRGFTLAFPVEDAQLTWTHVIAGVAAVITGVVLMVWPGPTLLVLAFFLGAWLTVVGTFDVVRSLVTRHERTHWVLHLVLGVVEVLLGIWAMRRPEASLNLLITILGLWCVITGVVLCVQAFEVRHSSRVLVLDLDASTPLSVSEAAARLDQVRVLRDEGLLTSAEYASLEGQLIGRLQRQP